MASSPTKRLLQQAMHYSAGSVLITIAGLVSYPFLTRMFSTGDYGAMSLVGATLTLCASVGKLGVQHSIIRYHPEVASGNSTFSLEQLYATSILGMVGTAAIVTLLFVLGTQLAPTHWLGDTQPLFAIVSILVLWQVVESIFVNAMRSEQMTVAVNKYQVLKKYVILGSFAAALLWIAPTLKVFYAASVLAEVVMVSALGFVAFRARIVPRFKTSCFSIHLYRRLLALGLPMMLGTELSGLVLMIGHRYVIGAFLGREAIGQYAAAYNLCQYVQQVFIYAVSLAFAPIYLRIWEEKGAEATSAFVSRSFRLYMALGAAVVGGLSAIAEPLLILLAGEKYASSASCLPLVMAGMVFDGTGPMLTAGLQIKRRTGTIMWIVVASAALNVVLNLVLVPTLGVLGSAIATAASYLACASANAWKSNPCLAIAPPWASMLRSTVAAAAMYWVLVMIPAGRPWLTVLIRVGVGVAAFVLFMCLLDAEARALLRTAVEHLRHSAKSARSSSVGQENANT